MLEKDQTPTEVSTRNRSSTIQFRPDRTKKNADCSIQKKNRIKIGDRVVYAGNMKPEYAVVKMVDHVNGKAQISVLAGLECVSRKVHLM